MRRATRIVIGIVGSLCLVATSAQAATPIRVVDTRAYEFGSAAAPGWLAWARGPTLDGDYDLAVKELGVGTTFFDAGRFQDVGNIDLGNPRGNILAFSVRPKVFDSSIRFLNMSTGRFVATPSGVNTSKDEDNPALWDNNLLFGRGPRRGRFSTRVILFAPLGSPAMTVAEAPPGGSISADSLRGDFATYTVCPSTGRCNVFRYQLSTEQKIKMPNPRRANYWSSVMTDGTVYFVQGSPAFCGLKTKIKRFQPGSVTTVYSFPNGIEVADLDAVELTPGSPTVFFTRINCPQNSRSGIWKIAG